MSAPESPESRPSGALAVGASLGPYVIVAPLGAGGMGEVYRAKDTKLGREVAIKVLPEDVAKDPERMARFAREAHVLASLNHPRIAAIYGLEESERGRGLVLELVEGETLAERIAVGAVPVEEALSIARQVAEALEAAHEKGIVHRDLKPANVKLTPDGSVKVLDFGLAKALASDPALSDVASSPTLTAQATRAGVILGTAAYMAPEQARGKSVDKRADIWAFGALLFELLTGRRAFEGETVSDTLAAVLTRDPDWAALPAATPESVRRLLHRCLDRDARRRLHDIADARLDLDETTTARAAVTVSPAANGRRFTPPVIGMAGLALVAAFLLGRGMSHVSSPPRAASFPVHATVALPKGQHLAGWASPELAFSPDGRRLAFVSESDGGAQQLFVQHLDRGEAQVVPDSENAEGPFFSPDGSWVAFAVDVSGRSGRPGQLKKFSLTTGLTQGICPIPDYFGGAWREDGTIFFVGVEQDGLFKVHADGGPPEPAVAKVRLGGKEVARSLFWPQLLPGGASVLLTDGDASTTGDAAVLDLMTGELKDLGVRALFARYAPTGHLLYVAADGTLLAVAFDASRHVTAGAPVAVLKDLALSGNNAGALAVSEAGALVHATGYLRGSGRELTRLVRFRPGRPDPQPLPFEADTFGRHPRLSADGRSLAVSTWDGSLWICDLERGSRTHLSSSDVAWGEWVAWTPDSRRVAFEGQKAGEATVGLFFQDVGANRPAGTLVTTAKEKHLGSWTPDGRTLLYSEFGAKGTDLWALETWGMGSPRRLLPGDNPAVSPDGDWLAYESQESGKIEVYVMSFPELGPRAKVTIDGGTLPRWSRDSRRIFFRNGDRFWAARMEPGAVPRVARPELLLEAQGIGGFDFDSDGNVVALWHEPESGMVRQLDLTLNWFDELRRLVPTSATR